MPKKRKARKALIFVVEDDSVILEYLKTVLTDLNYNVASSSNGCEALEKIVQDSPSLVCLDVLLPDMDGLTLCQKLKANPKTSKIPVIMLSCLSDSATLRNAYSHGAIDFIAKPFKQAILRDKIEKALSGSKDIDF